MFINHQQGNFQASICSENQISISGGFYGVAATRSITGDEVWVSTIKSVLPGPRAEFGRWTKGKEEKLPGLGCKYLS